jgi:hypothetical protein
VLGVSRDRLSTGRRRSTTSLGSVDNIESLQTVAGEDVLPGLELPVDEVFE